MRLPLFQESRRQSKKNWYRSLAKVAGQTTSRPITFIAALSLIVLWGITGPLFGFSDTWQLVVNTATTIVSFLMGFLIQNTQSRDAKSIQIKLDELIRTTKNARVELLALDDLSDEQLENVYRRYRSLAKATKKKLGGKRDPSSSDGGFPPEA